MKLGVEFASNGLLFVDMVVILIRKSMADVRNVASRDPASLPYIGRNASAMMAVLRRELDRVAP
jgi:hypothetical protein